MKGVGKALVPPPTITPRSGQVSDRAPAAAALLMLQPVGVLFAWFVEVSYWKGMCVGCLVPHSITTNPISGRVSWESRRFPCGSRLDWTSNPKTRRPQSSMKRRGVELAKPRNDLLFYSSKTQTDQGECHYRTKLSN